MIPSLCIGRLDIPCIPVLQLHRLRTLQVSVHRSNVAIEVELEASTVRAVWTLEKSLTSVGQHMVPEFLLAINATHALATDGTHDWRHRLQQRGERPSLLHTHHTSLGSLKKKRKNRKERKEEKDVIRQASWLTEEQHTTNKKPKIKAKFFSRKKKG